ncbi:MAG: teicoplanin resistance protein VanZ [Deltaproteobacteria bacterium CG11_big_fil_rev_8_21_14_0_20_47_16]|nr:MAG: teicoplanin resistance protein VanZ [Deltaproteobacteria bacterium CG11_big_fil_rev_8_21_14_0_20_47_16]
MYAAGIFYLSSGPSPDIPPPFPNFDKVVHVTLYTGFSFFVARAVCFQWKEISRMTLWLTIAISSLYGLSDEIHQFFVPTRSCDVLDWCADVVGSVLGVFVFSAYRYSLLKCRFKKSIN